LLAIQGIGKSFSTGERALDRVSLEIAAGEIVSVIGGSGSGKSTLLRLVAGLDVPSEGRILIEGTPVLRPHPAIGLVFQEPRLLPWLAVKDNVGFGLTGLPAAERRERVMEALVRVGLAANAGHWPRQLSGGMAQRVALARALVARPRALLLDEPFSALDALTRASLQDHLVGLWVYERPTFVLVTHDIEEALILADRVVVLGSRPGRITATMSVPLARPRDRDDPAFEALKHELRHALVASFAPAAPPS
jgi:sulfonate transport system ATP-binding protein